MHVVALRGLQYLVNPAAQLLLVARFGVAEFGVYLAAQALAAALGRLVAFGVVDFAVRELILRGEARHWTFKAIYLSRLLAFVAVTLLIVLVFHIFGFSAQYVALFALFWVIQLTMLSNKMIMSLARALNRLRSQRWIYVNYLAIDVLALVLVAAGSVGYVGYLAVRCGGLLLVALGEVWRYREFFWGWRNRAGEIWREFRRTWILSTQFGVLSVLRDLSDQWLVVAASFLMTAELFGLAGLVHRFSMMLTLLLVVLMETVSYPRLVRLVRSGGGEFARGYRRMRQSYGAIALGAGALLAMVLAGTERFVLGPGESFGWMLAGLGVLHLVVHLQLMVPVKLIAAAGRVRDRLRVEPGVVVAGYGVLLATTQAWPLGTLILAQLATAAATFLLLAPLIRDIEREARLAPPATVGD